MAWLKADVSPKWHLFSTRDPLHQRLCTEQRLHYSFSPSLGMSLRTRAAWTLIRGPLCSPALDSPTMTFLEQSLFTPAVGEFKQNWFQWKKAVSCILTSVHTHLKTAHCYHQQCCMCACWIPPAQAPTSPQAFPNVLNTQVCAHVYFYSCVQCSSPKHSHLHLQTSGAAWHPSTVLQPLSSSSALCQTQTSEKLLTSRIG